MNKSIAFFDFDGTVINKDSLWLFISFSTSKVQQLFYFFYFLPMFIACKLGLYCKDLAKEKLLSKLYKNKSQLELENLASNFYYILYKYCNAQAMQKIQWHKGQGHRVVIVSASPELWVKIFAQEHCLECIATKLEYQNKLFTGNFLGKNCNKSEKVHRIAEYVGDIHNYVTYAYGDSRGDKEMLESVDFSFYRQF